ncbi:hypothetical protein AB5V95_00500 [Metamycoplasma spumans]|uniref:hypothetical protein n=1 Tax=Metamycoplasma spumans TaxID=92406 RepID=UPI0034DDB71A
MKDNNKKKKNKKIAIATTAALLLLGAAAGGTAAGLILTKKAKFEASKKEATELVNAIPDNFYKKPGLLEKLLQAKTYEDYIAISAEARIAIEEAKAGKEDPEKVREAKLKASLAINRLEVNNKLKAKLLNDLNKGDIKIVEIYKIEKEAEKEYQADRSRRVSENKQTKNFINLLITKVNNKEKSDLFKEKLDALEDDTSVYKNRENGLNKLADLVKDESTKKSLKEQISKAILTPEEEALAKKAELEEFAKSNLQADNAELKNLIDSLNKAIENSSENPVASLRKLSEIQKKIEEEIKKEDGADKLLAAKKLMLEERINSSTLSTEAKKSEIAKIKATDSEKEFERASAKAEVVLSNQKENDIKAVEKAIEEALKTSLSESEILKAKKEQLKEKINASTLLPSEKEKMIADLESANTLAKFNTNKEIIEDQLNQEKEKQNSKQVAELLNSIEDEIDTQLTSENENPSKSAFDIKKEIVADLINKSSLSADEKQKIQAELESLNREAANALQSLKEISNRVNAQIAFNEAKAEANKLIDTLEEPKKSELKEKLNSISNSDHNEIQKIISEAKDEANSEDKKDALTKAEKLVSKLDDSNPIKQELLNQLNNHQDLLLSQINKIIDEAEAILDSKEEGQLSRNNNEKQLLESLINDVKDPNKKEELTQALKNVEETLNDNSKQILDYLNNLADKVSNSDKASELKQKASDAVVTPEEKLENKASELNKLIEGLSETTSNQLKEKLSEVLNNNDLDTASKQTELDKLIKEAEKAIIAEKGSDKLIEKQKEILNSRIESSNLTPEQKTAEKEKVESINSLESLKEKEDALTKVLKEQNAKDIKEVEKAIDEELKKQNAENSEASLLKDKKEVIKNLIQSNPNLSDAQKQDMISNIEETSTLEEFADEKAKIDKIIEHENKKSKASEVAKKLEELSKQAQSILGNQIGTKGLANKRIEDLKNSINNSNLPESKKNELISSLDNINTSEDNAIEQVDSQKAKINKELELQAVKHEALSVVNRLNDSEEKQKLINDINSGTIENIDEAKKAAQDAKKKAEEKLITALNEAKGSINRLVGAEEEMTKLNSELVNASTEQQRDAIKAKAEELINNKLAEAREEANKLDETNPKKTELLNKIAEAEKDKTSNFKTFNDLLKEAQAEESKEEEKKKAKKELDSATNISEEERAKLAQELESATDTDEVISKKDEIIKKKEFTDTRKAASDLIDEIQNEAKKAELKAALDKATTKEEADAIRANALDYKNKEVANKAKADELRQRINALQTESKKTELLANLDKALKNENDEPNKDTEAVKAALESLSTDIDAAFNEEQRVTESLTVKKEQLAQKIALINDSAKKSEFEAELDRINKITDPAAATEEANKLDNKVETQKAFETKKSDAQAEINKLRLKDSAAKAKLQEELNRATTIEEAQRILEEAQKEKAKEDKQIEDKRKAVNDALAKLQDGSELKNTLIAKKDEAAPSDDETHRTVDLAALESIVTSVDQKINELKEATKAAIDLTNGLQANGDEADSHDSLNEALNDEQNQTEEKLNELKNKADAAVANARNKAIEALGQTEGKELSDKKKALQEAINDKTKNISELKELLNKVTLENELEAKAEKLIADANKIQDPAQRQALINKVNNLMNSSNDADRTINKLEEIENEISSSNEQQERARNEAYTQAKEAINSIQDGKEKQKLLSLLQKPDTEDLRDDLTASDIQDIKNAAEAFKNFEDRKKEAREKLESLPQGNNIRTSKLTELEAINNSEADAISKIEQIKRVAEEEARLIKEAVDAALEKIEQLVGHADYESIKEKVKQKDSDNNEVAKIQKSGNDAEEIAIAWKAAKTSLEQLQNELPNNNAEKVRIASEAATSENINNLEKVNALISRAESEKTKLLNAIDQVKKFIDSELPTNAKAENSVAMGIIAKLNVSTNQLAEDVNEESEIIALKEQITAEKTKITELLSSTREVHKSLPEGNSVKVKHQDSMADTYFGELVNTTDKITTIKNELEVEKTAIDSLKQEINVQLNNANLKDSNPRKSEIKQLIEGTDVNGKTHPKERSEFQALKDELVELNKDLAEAKKQAQDEINKLPARNALRAQLQNLLDSMNSDHDEVSEINKKIRDVATTEVNNFIAKYELIQAALEALPTNNPKRVEVNKLVSSDISKNNGEELSEISKLEAIEAELKQLKTNLDSAIETISNYLANKLPANNTVRSDLTAKLNEKGEDADEVDEINAFKAQIDNEFNEMTTLINSLKLKLEELPANDTYRTAKENIANINLKDQTELSNESDITKIINAIENTEIPRVDEARMALEFDENPENAKFNNSEFTLKTNFEEISDNKFWASVDTNVYNVLPKLEDNQSYKKLSSGVETAVDKNTTVGTLGEVTYNLYQGDTKIKEFKIFGTRSSRVTFNNGMTTKLQGSNQLGVKPEWSLGYTGRGSNDNINNLVDNNYGPTSRFELWSSYNKEQNDNNFVIYKKNSNGAGEESAWYTKLDLYIRFSGGFGEQNEERYDGHVPREVRISYSDDGISWNSVQNQSHIYDYDWFNESAIDRRTGAIKQLKTSPSAIKNNRNNSFDQDAQVRGDTGSMNKNNWQNESIVRIRTSFTPIEAKYIRVSWLSAIDPREKSGDSTGLKVTAWTEVKPYVLTESGVQHFKANDVNAIHTIPDSLTIAFNNIEKQLNSGETGYIVSEPINNEISGNNIEIQNKHSELSYSIRKIKSFKYSSNAQKEVYSEFLITVKNAINEIKTFKVKIGNRPVNTDLVNDFNNVMSESNNDPKGVVRRFRKDIERWSNYINAFHDEKWNGAKNAIQSLKTEISSPDYTINPDHLDMWKDIKNLIINIKRENSSTNNGQAFEDKLNEVRAKWSQLQQAITEDNHEKLNQLYEIHQQMMNDLSKTLDDLDEHIKWIDKEILKINGQGA